MRYGARQWPDAWVPVTLLILLRPSLPDNEVPPGVSDVASLTLCSTWDEETWSLSVSRGAFHSGGATRWPRAVCLTSGSPCSGGRP